MLTNSKKRIFSMFDFFATGDARLANACQTQSFLFTTSLATRFVQTLFSLGLLLLLFGATSLRGPALVISDDRFTPCQPAEKFIELRVTSKTIAAAGTMPERRVWIIQEFPSDAQVQVATDRVFKEQILRVLTQIRTENEVVSVGKAGNPEPGDPAHLETLLLADIDSMRPGIELRMPLELTSPPRPSDQDQVFTVRICLVYVIPPPPNGAQFEIRTLAGDSAPLGNFPALTLANASARFRDRPEGAIPVRISYAQQDLDDARRNPAVTTEAAALEHVQKELLKVAVAGFDLAVAEGLLAADGQSVPDSGTAQTTAANLQEKLTGLYNLNAIEPTMRWGMVSSRVGVVDATPGSPWNIVVSGLQLAQKVVIRVSKSAVELDITDPGTAQKLDKKREAVRSRLTAQHLENFQAQPGNLITAKDIEADKDRLRKDTESVKKVEDIASSPPAVEGGAPPQDLIYTVSRHLKGEQVLTAKLGASYSPEEDFSGNAGIETLNVLGISETAKLDYSGGGQVQKIRFNFDVPFESSGTAGWHFKTFTINVQYFGDKDERFGNLTAEEIEARETGSEARLSLGYDSFSVLDHSAAECLIPERKRTRYYLNLTPSLVFRDVNIKDDDLLLTITKLDKNLLPQARTQSTTLTLDGNAGLSHDFGEPTAGGLGMFNAYLKGRLQRGVQLFGGDYQFNKLSATFTTELFFGYLSPKDFFLRYNHVMGTSTRGTPVFELFRLGGPQSVRGLQEGEIIGRKLIADQVELGLNTLVLWHLLTGKSVTAALHRNKCDENAEPSALPFDLANTYIKGFYDRGHIDDQDSFVTPGATNRVAQGYGIALEIRELGSKSIHLSFGYARSPESALHKSGTLYTGVSYSF
jgi:hypothetical protein